MTIQDRPVFARRLDALAEMFSADCNEQRTDGYWSALKDISLDVFERACEEGQKEWRRFPVPASIREVAERVKPSIYRPAPPQFTDDHEPIYACLDCQDIGLQPVRKSDKKPIRFDEMMGSHADYTMRRCPCIKDNHVIQARHASMMKLAKPNTQRWGG